MIILPLTEVLHIIHTQKKKKIVINLFIEWEAILSSFRYLTIEHATVFYLCLNHPHWYYSADWCLRIMMNYQNGHSQVSWSSWVTQLQCVFKDSTDFQQWMSPAASPILFLEQPNLSLSNSLPFIADSFLIAFIHLKLPNAPVSVFSKASDHPLQDNIIFSPVLSYCSKCWCGQVYKKARRVWMAYIIWWYWELVLIM